MFFEFPITERKKPKFQTRMMWSTIIFALLILDSWHLTTGFFLGWDEPFSSSSAVHRRYHCSHRFRVQRLKSQTDRTNECWFPKKLLNESELESDSKDFIRADLECQSLKLASTLLSNVKDAEVIAHNENEKRTYSGLARDRFRDLCCNRRGELILENMFERIEERTETRIVLGAIMSLQSLLVFGMQYGAKANTFTAKRNSMDDDCGLFVEWNGTCSKKLKSQCSRIPAINLLAKMKRKRSPQGAYDFLVSLGIWKANEDLGLLRSGFSLRFDENELRSAEKACSNDKDVDQLLKIRKDLTYQKVYTIDSASTTEIDDGLSIEKFNKDDGSSGKRIWIHIADADRWAPRGSGVFEIARKRATSIYLPQGSIPMIPEALSSEKMSLNANVERSALSLGVELAHDGSIIDSSIMVTSSTIKVSYRLTYDDVDEMLEDGVAYNEEWELGALFAFARARRKYRMSNGSAEAFVPTQIPQCTINTFFDNEAKCNIGIDLKIQVSHNGGKNQSMVEYCDQAATMAHASPVSAASMLVTEMMILAGESIGRWKIAESRDESNDFCPSTVQNSLRLPFRTQPRPDYRSRMREKKIMEDLLENNIGDGLCHAWYARRFLSPVEIKETPSPHSGLGIQCYTQWTSPIRRFGDLQVHTTVKRYLRRKKLIEMINFGYDIPTDVTKNDLGCDPSMLSTNKGSVSEGVFDTDIDFKDGLSCLRGARAVQRSSQTYWVLEFIKRMDRNKNFQAVVLGCRNPARRQYVVYLFEIGFEWLYCSPVDNLTSGTRILLKATNILPHNGQMTLVRAQV